jgi:hypothetical protein
MRVHYEVNNGLAGSKHVTSPGVLKLILLGVLTVYHDTYFVEGEQQNSFLFFFLDHPRNFKNFDSILGYFV